MRPGWASTGRGAGSRLTAAEREHEKEVLETKLKEELEAAKGVVATKMLQESLGELKKSKE